jgi:penicillin-binding protein 1A
MPLSTALAKSLNTVAVDLSLRIGREKVLANVEQLGITGVRKSCSMALGDTGISVLEHTQGYAHFASGGLSVRAFAFTEIQNSKNEIVYLRERDEPERQQVFERRHAEMMNQMLHEVVENGTGKRAHLEFAPVAGKTGTSSSYRDAWFMGFTGKYVAGVWFGNDDYKPMNKVTGGSLPAQTWANFMNVAHRTSDIPPVPGLPYDPQQAAKARLAAEAAAADDAQKQSEAKAAAAAIMPVKAREAIRRLAGTFKRTADGQAPAAPAPADAEPPGAAKPSPAKSRNDRKAEQTPAAPTRGELRPSQASSQTRGQAAQRPTTGAVR